MMWVFRSLVPKQVTARNKRMKKETLIFGLVVCAIVLTALTYYLAPRLYYGRAWDNVHLLVRWGHANRLDDLLDGNPALANARRPGDGNAPLHMIIATPPDEVARIVEILMHHGADVNAVNGAGVTALHYAAGEGKLEAVKALLRAGADPYAGDPFMGSAIDEAERYGTPEIAELLRAAAAENNP